MAKIVAAITTRWNSTRLPGKALIDILGKPCLERIIDRLQGSALIKDIVVATTLDSQPIIEFCHGRYNYYAGSEDDILDRLYQAAKPYEPDYIVRVWGDCPMIEGTIIDAAILELLLHISLGGGCDYLFTKGRPKGQDVAVIPLKTLEKDWHRLLRKEDREWYHKYILEHPTEYRIAYSVSFPDRSHDETLALDTPEDLERIRKIYANYQEN